MIVTCFFIDTSRNILDYLEKIFYLLKPGGHWINFGPLMYHFADLKNDKSLELTYEQLRYAILKKGFNYIVSLCQNYYLTLYFYMFYNLFYRKKRLTLDQHIPKIRIQCFVICTIVLILCVKNHLIDDLVYL